MGRGIPRTFGPKLGSAARKSVKRFSVRPRDKQNSDAEFSDEGAAVGIDFHEHTVRPKRLWLRTT